MWARSEFQPGSPSPSVPARRPQLSAAPPGPARRWPLMFIPGQLMPRKRVTGPSELSAAEACLSDVCAIHISHVCLIFQNVSSYLLWRWLWRCVWGGSWGSFHSDPSPPKVCAKRNLPSVKVSGPGHWAVPPPPTYDIIPGPGRLCLDIYELVVAPSEGGMLVAAVGFHQVWGFP